MNSLKTILIVLTVISMASTSEAGWLIYHESEFKGTILDIETEQPIEGAVVVAVYKKAAMGLGAGTISSIINVRESLTDKDGNFRIPSYTTLIQLFSWQIPTTLIIFKPGYVSLEVGTWHFLGKELKEKQEKSLWWGKELKYRLRSRGIVELPLLRTREERLKDMPSPVGAESDYKKQKLFIRLINEERKNLGLSREYIIRGGH